MTLTQLSLALSLLVHASVIGIAWHIVPRPERLLNLSSVLVVHLASRPTDMPGSESVHTPPIRRRAIPNAQQVSKSESLSPQSNEDRVISVQNYLFQIREQIYSTLKEDLKHFRPGKLELRLTLKSDGLLKDPELLERSGNPALDQAVIASVMNIRSFPPLPPKARPLKELSFRLPIEVSQ